MTDEAAVGDTDERRRARLRRPLIELLLGTDSAARSAARALDDDAWLSAVALARGWKALPQLRRRLTALGIDLPAPAGPAIRAESRRAFVDSALALKMGARSLGALAGRGVDALAIKGAAAIAALYPGPHGRTITDVDILVRPGDLERVMEALATIGLRPEIEATLDEYLQFVRDSPGFAGNEALSLYASDGREVDVHWRIGRIEIPELLEHSDTATLYGQRVRIPCPAHCLLLSSHHIVRNTLDPDTTVRDLVDARGWIDLIDEAEIQDLPEKAADAGLRVATAATIEVLERLCPSKRLGAVTEVFRTQLPPSRRSDAASLAELYFRQVDHGPVDADLLLLRPTAVRQIARGLGRNARRYRRLMRNFESRAHGSAVPLVGRMRRLARAAARLEPSDWGRLRVLARVRRLSLD